MSVTTLVRVPVEAMSALPERIARRVVLRDGCLIWQGATNSRGYGCITNGHGKSVLVHRVAFEHAVGPIGDGLTIDHLCRQKTCVRIDHLQAVSRRENAIRAAEADGSCQCGRASCQTCYARERRRRAAERAPGTHQAPDTAGRITVATRLDAEEVAALRAAADADGVAVAVFVRRVLRTWLAATA